MILYDMTYIIYRNVVLQTDFVVTGMSDNTSVRTWRYKNMFRESLPSARYCV